MTDEEPNPGWDGYLGPKQWVPALFVVAVALIAMGLFVVVRGGDDDDSPGTGGTLRQAVHWHADLALFINGEKFDFNQPQFLATEDNAISSGAHIHPPRTNVIHAHLEQTTWSEFFSSIGFDLRDTSLTMPDGTIYEDGPAGTLKFFVNNVQVDTIRVQDISDLTRVLISYGPEDPEEVLATQWPEVTDEACIVSGVCIERGIPDEEPCGPNSTSCN